MIILSLLIPSGNGAKLRTQCQQGSFSPEASSLARVSPPPGGRTVTAKALGCPFRQHYLRKQTASYPEPDDSDSIARSL